MIVVAYLLMFLAVCCDCIASVILPGINLLARLCCDNSFLSYYLCVPNYYYAVLNLVDTFDFKLGLKNQFMN